MTYTFYVDFKNLYEIQNIIDHLPQVVVSLDRDGKVLLHNGSLRELLPPGKTEVMGKELLNILHPWEEGDARALRGLLQLPMDGRERTRISHGIALKTSWSSRSIFRAQLYRREPLLPPVDRGSPGAAEGGAEDYMLMLEDVTLLRQMEEEYRRVQRIQSLLPLLRGFGNDFKERLTVMYGSLDYCLELLRDEDARTEELTGHLRDGARTVIRNLEKVNGRLDNILRLSNGGRQAYGDVSLEDMVREAGEQALLGSNKSLDISMSGPLPLITGDYSKLLQMIQNILLNAVQAGPDSYSIEVSGEALQRGGMDYVLLTISDHGPGMSVDIRSRAEQPFFSTRENSDGLGLFVAKNIALEHNGSLELESSPGGGTRVHVYLPVQKESSLPSSRRQLPQGIKLLVLDDNPDIQEVWERLLYQLGIQGSFASSTSQVFEKFEQALHSDYPFHMVVLEDNESDIPDVFQILARLRKLEAGLPAVYSSSGIPRVGAHEIRARGFGAVLRKPFRMFDLQAALLQAYYGAVGGGDPDHP